MEKLLFVDSCITLRPRSYTLEMCKHFISEFTREAPAIIERVDLVKNAPQPLSTRTLTRRDALISNGKLEDPMFALAHQAAAADVLLIGAPYWDLSFPAVLKDYIENIMVCGVTFKYENDRSVGLCRARELVYVSAAGGVVPERHLGYEYICAIAQMLGIGSTRLICADKLDIYGVDAAAEVRRVCGSVTAGR